MRTVNINLKLSVDDREFDMTDAQLASIINKFVDHGFDNLVFDDSITEDIVDNIMNVEYSVVK